MGCFHCSSSRILSIGGKCNDLCDYSLNGEKPYEDYNYVPDDMGVGSGDYISFDLCLDCGQVQDQWPKPKTKFEEELEERKIHPFKPGDYVEFNVGEFTIVGEVQKYVMESGMVTILSHGVWDEEKGRPGNDMWLRGKPKSKWEIFWADEHGLKKTTKEW